MTNNYNILKRTFAILFITVLNLTASAQWAQLGETIYSDSNDDLIGKSVSISGDGLTMASIGYVFIDTDTKVWELELYNLVGDSWIAVDHQLTLPEAWSIFEVKLNSDGTTLAISSPFGGYPELIPGAVQVFTLVDGNWVQKGDAIIGDTEESRITGHIAISSNGLKLAIGSLEPNAGITNARVTVFRFADNNWTQYGAAIENVSFDDFNWNFDFNMSGDGSTIGVKTAMDGEYKLYTFDSENWISKGSAIIIPHTFDHLLHTITLNNDGSVVAVSDPNVDDYNNFYFYAGLVRVYGFDETDWIQMGEDIYGEEDDLLGSSIAMTPDGLKIALGAPRYLPFLGADITDGGHVRVLNYDGTNWIQEGQYIESDGTNTRNGSSVGFNHDGTTLVVSSPGHDDNIENLAAIKTYSYQPSVSILENTFGNNIRMNPNPATNQITIDLGDNQVSSIIISNSLGQEVKTMNEISGSRQQLSLDGFDWGIYFVRLSNGVNSRILKLVKQ